MSLRVLITEDSTPMRRLLARFLNAAGVPHVVEAEDGEKALALFKPHGFDLVLVDWILPGMSGVELVREIRKLDEAVVITMLTSLAEEKNKQEAIQAGVNDYLVKPLVAQTRDRLLEICHEIAARRDGRSPSD